MYCFINITLCYLSGSFVFAADIVRKIADITNGSSELTIEQQRSVVTELNRLLFCLKELSKLYQVALTEFSNEQLYSEYKKMFDEILKIYFGNIENRRLAAKLSVDRYYEYLENGIVII